MASPAEKSEEEKMIDSGPGTSPTIWRNCDSISVLPTVRSSEGFSSMDISARWPWPLAPATAENEVRRPVGWSPIEVNILRKIESSSPVSKSIWLRRTIVFSSMNCTTFEVWVTVVPCGILIEILTQSDSILGMKTNFIWPPATIPKVPSISAMARAVLESGLANARRNVGR